jgi:hypothetical protein
MKLRVSREYMGSFKMEKNGSLKDQIKGGGIFLVILSFILFFVVGPFALLLLVLGLVMAIAGKYASE